MLHRVNQRKKWALWGVLLLLQVIIHLPYMNRVAMGNHVWRQCNTLAVAKNYYETDMNILYPRIDKNYGTNGVTGPQFTSYDYSLAILYKVFGFSETLHRWFSLFLSLCAILGTLFLLEQYFPNGNVAFWGGLAMIGIPEFYYYSIAALPDLLALAAMVWGWWWFYRFLKTRKMIDAFVAGLLLALAGMTKLMFLIPGFVFLGEILQKKQWSLKNILGYTLMGALAIGSSLAWYVWAKHLTQINGIEEFVHAIRFKETWSEALLVLVKNLGIDVVETWVGYPLIFPAIWALLALLKNRATDLRVLFSLLAAALYYVFMQHQLEHHGYYMMLFVPFIVWLVAYFVHTWPVHKWNFFLGKPYHAYALLLLAPAWSILRMHHNFNTHKPNIPISFTNSKSRTVLQNMTKQKKIWIVGPDQSGCVNFYFLGAKGFPWYKVSDQGTEFTQFKERGAQGIITDNEPAAIALCEKQGLEVRVKRYKEWSWLLFN
jgi:hypothetical protein